MDTVSIRPDAAPQREGEEVRPARPEAPPGVNGAPRAAPRPRRNGSGPRGRTVRYDDQARRAGRDAPAVEVRRVRRVLRRVDSWSLFRFAIVLYTCGLVVFLAAAIGLWIVASAAGAIPSIETFITQLFALKHFSFKAGQLFLGTLGVGLVGVFAATLFTVITGVLYNLISDVVGGVEITVLEEEPIEVVP